MQAELGKKLMPKLFKFQYDNTLSDNWNKKFILKTYLNSNMIIL